MSHRSSISGSTDALAPTDPPSTDSVPCVICGSVMDRKTLEGHISSDHLDYYPYSCGHCGHFMPTEENVVFHAEKKNHLPLKIRENLNKTKEQKLQELLQESISASLAPPNSSTPSTGAYSQQGIEPEEEEELEIAFVDPLGRDRSSSKSSINAVPKEFPLIANERAEAACITVAKNLKAISSSPPKRVPVKLPYLPKPVLKKFPEPNKLPSILPKSQIHNPPAAKRTESPKLAEEFKIKLSTPPPVKQTEKPKPSETKQQHNGTVVSPPKVQEVYETPVTASSFTVTEKPGLKLLFTAKPETTPPDQKPSKSVSIPKPVVEPWQPPEKPIDEKPAAAVVPNDPVVKPSTSPVQIKHEVSPAAATPEKPILDGSPVQEQAGYESPVQSAAVLEKPLDSILTRVSSDSESPISIPLQVAETPTPPPLQPLVPPKNPITEFMAMDQGLPTMVGIESPAPKVPSPTIIPTPVVTPIVQALQAQRNFARTPMVPVAKLKRGIEQIANQLAASSTLQQQQQPPPAKVQKFQVDHYGSSYRRHSPVSLVPMKPEPTIVVHHKIERPKMSISPHWQRSHCKVCAQYVAVGEIMQHVRRHIDTRPQYGCLYCNFKGRTPNSVRVHITWKHANCRNFGAGTVVESLSLGCARAGAGVKDISSVGETEEDMLGMCFPNFTSEEVDKYCMENPLVSAMDSSPQQLPVFSAPSTGAYVERQSGSPNVLKLPTLAAAAVTSDGGAKFSGSTITRTATMPSGRVYRYMHCTACGAEVIDALASSHIYQTHINRRDAIQCGYCEYGVPYAIAEVKRHVQAKHPYMPQKIIDRRPEMQEEYMAWRLRCFPDIGTRQPQKAGTGNPDLVSSSSKFGMDSRPTMVDMSSTSGSDNVLIDILKRPPLQIQETLTPREPAINAHTGTMVSAHQKYWSQAHIRNSKKTKCMKCFEEITHLWANRHIWRHLEGEQMSRYKCKAPGCEYQTYLMRSLDTHCNYHGKGLTAEMVGFEDRADKLRDAWVNCWKECFGDEEIPMNSDSPDGISGSSTLFTNASMISGDGKLAPSDETLNLLMVAAHGQDQVNSTLQRASSSINGDNSSIHLVRSSPPICSTSTSSSRYSLSHVSSLSPNEMRLPVIRSSTNGHVVSMPIPAMNQDTWCEKCSCSVHGNEVEDHIWFAHLGGILPYRCGRCQRSFMSEQLVRDHWELEHYMSPSAGFNNSMEITKNQHARVRFENELIECFPDLA